MSWWNWSLTAASNGSADPTINFSEGQSPSSVNDSARSLMARSAEYRDLISGKLVTTGTGTALVLASGQNPVYSSLAVMDGQMIGFTPNATNTGNVTLAVDGLAAKPIRSQTGVSGNLGAGVLIVGTPYIATYYNSVGEFILQGFAGTPSSVPLGSMLFHSVAVVPNSNFVMPIGQAISRTTYATYFAMVGTTFGPGDGSTTFNIPDMRSRFPLPLATMGGADPGRVTTAGSGVDGATIGAIGGAQNVTLDTTMIPAHTHPSPTVTDPTHKHFIFNTDVAGSATSPTNADQPAFANNLGNDNSAVITGTATPATVGLTSASGTGITLAVATGSTGGGLAHNNMPPCLVLPLILRVL